MAVHIWSEEEKEYLRQITPGHHYREIIELMNNKFEYQFNYQQIKGAISRYKLNTGFNGQFKKGNIPYNKGTKGLTGANRNSFKKGHIPLNYRPVGSERVNVDGYTEIKVADPNKWKLKHRVIWEQHYGPITKENKIIFLDNNKTNLNIENLAMVTNTQLLIMNGNKLIKKDADLTRVGVNIAKIYEKIREVNSNT